MEVRFFPGAPIRKSQIALLGMMTLPIIYAVAKIISLFYYDSRPFVSENFTPLIPHTPDNGFPSDHTLLTAAIASIFYPFSKKKISAILWILTLLVGFSRVYAGIHYPIDTFGAIGIVIIIVMLACHYFLRKRYEIFKFQKIIRKF